MKPFLALVDLQVDYLCEPGLEPHRSTVIGGAAELLRAARERGWAVCHVWTTARRDPDDRMPHWKSARRWNCLDGTAGHAPPPKLAPLAGEKRVHKTGFNPFREPQFAEWIRANAFDWAVVAGIHTHACVRETVLGLHELGLTVRVAREAVGSREPHHAAQTEIYLRRRGIAFGGLDEIVSQPDGKLNRGVLSALAPTNEQWERAAMLGSAAYLLERNAEPLAAQVTRDIGKPLHFSRGEVARAAALFRAVARRISAPAEDEREAEATVRRRPHGIVAMLTPWNNPLAIAAGQFAPAFGFGNAVVWKPAPAGLSIGMEFRRLLLEAGLPPAALQVVSGGEQAGLDLMSRPGIDAVWFTGSTAAGRIAACICAESNKPLQAELGGNNGVIVTGDMPGLESIAREVANAAFGCAGQRCTATRRVIVLDSIHNAFLECLMRFTAALARGAPEAEATRVGPLPPEF